MYKSFTLAIPVTDPLIVANWYRDYLGTAEVRSMGDDVYEIEITPSIWLQFYCSEVEQAPFILRFGVHNLDEIVKRIQKTGHSPQFGQKMGGVRYLYSKADPWGHKIGFYELTDIGVD